MTKEAKPRISILWALPEHADELARLHGGLFNPAWDAPAFHKLLANPGSTAFVATLGKPPEAIGFILGQLAADEAEILMMAVRTERQRQGVGKMLVEALSRAAKRAEARRLFLEVAAGNTAALALYRGLGFQEVGRRRAYYVRADGPPDDALVLALAL